MQNRKGLNAYDDLSSMDIGSSMSGIVSVVVESNHDFDDSANVQGHDGSMMFELPLRDECTTVGELCEQIASVLGVDDGVMTWPFCVYRGMEIINAPNAVQRTWHDAGIRPGGVLTVMRTTDAEEMGMTNNAYEHRTSSARIQQRRLVMEQDAAYRDQEKLSQELQHKSSAASTQHMESPSHSVDGASGAAAAPAPGDVSEPDDAPPGASPQATTHPITLEDLRRRRLKRFETS